MSGSLIEWFSIYQMLIISIIITIMNNIVIIIAPVYEQLSVTQSLYQALCIQNTIHYTMTAILLNG